MRLNMVENSCQILSADRYVIPNAKSANTTLVLYQKIQCMHMQIVSENHQLNMQSDMAQADRIACTFSEHLFQIAREANKE